MTVRVESRKNPLSRFLQKGFGIKDIGAPNNPKLTFRAGHGGSSLQSQHFGRPRQVGHLRSGVQDQPGQHGKTLSLLKIQKLAGRGGAPLLIPATQEAEVGESLEPGRQRLQ